MATYMNSGAKDIPTGSDFKTKSALKAAITANPTNVSIYVTDAFGPNAGKIFRADNLDEGVKYTVTGPNPYTSRKWYATVEKTAKGVKVS